MTTVCMGLSVPKLRNITVHHESVYFQSRLMENHVWMCQSVLLLTLSVVRELANVLPLDTWMESVVLTVCIVSYLT